MAWDRLVELSVGSDGTGVAIADLDMEFNIQRSTTFSENSAEFTIYNAKESTRSDLLQKGANIIFKAGYADEGNGISSIFIGNIVSSLSTKQNADWVTHITATSFRDSKTPYERLSVGLSYGPGTKVSTILQELGSLLQIPVQGLENVSSISLPNGYVFTGKIRAALAYCQEILWSHSTSLFLDNSAMIIHKGSRDALYSAGFLDYDSGLLSVKEIDDTFRKGASSPGDPDGLNRRISFTSLLLPKLRPNGLIQIDTPEIAGTFLVEEARFFGDNFGGDFQTSAECVG